MLAWLSFGLKRERAIVLVVVGPLLVGTGALGEDKDNPAETSMVKEPRALGGLRLCAATHPCPSGKVNFYSKMAMDTSVDFLGLGSSVS